MSHFGCMSLYARVSKCRSVHNLSVMCSSEGGREGSRFGVSLDDYLLVSCMHRLLVQIKNDRRVEYM